MEKNNNNRYMNISKDQRQRESAIISAQKNQRILLSHGSGGKLTHDLIKDVFAKHFKNEYLDRLDDSAKISLANQNIAFTTDSYVVKPIKFPGGDIGKLAICGTVNDLAVAGAKPLYLSCGFIIEEGLEFSLLEEIVASMARAARDCGVSVVTGDTKVVEHGSADGLFINTSGIGIKSEGVELGIDKIQPGDKIIINGNIGDHGMAVMAVRNDLGISSKIISDCAPLNDLIDNILSALNSQLSAIKFMRDPTRGGLATTLCEIAEGSKWNIEISEKDLPISAEVRAVAEILGIDPLYSANEGKVVAVVSKDAADIVLNAMKQNPLGENARIIGTVTNTQGENALLRTEIDTIRQISMLTGDQLPRIC